MPKLYWNIRPTAPDYYLAETNGFSPLLKQILYNRNLRDLPSIEAFIDANESLCHDPYLMQDMEIATSRIYQGLLSGEKIAVYGDFDADGITGTVLLVQALSKLGGNAFPYIPHRMNEGHGINRTALNELKELGISLIITTDCGVNGIAEASMAKRKGIDLIITDHHNPVDELPCCTAVINPKRADSNYPFKELAGVGVSYKLVRALYQSVGRIDETREFLDLVAIGTVADMMPLIGENRYLVKEGLQVINENPRLGIRNIMELAGLSQGNVAAEDIAWAIAPRLNASGRLEHALGGYNLLITKDWKEAYRLAAKLEEQNLERQKVTLKAFNHARGQIPEGKPGSLLIAEDDDYPAGIIGLVAGRLTNEFYRPSIVIKTGAKVCQGSCRSIAEFDMIEAINSLSTHLDQFGGHPQAAGFTIKTANLPTFLKELTMLANSKLGELDLKPYVDIDAEVKLNTLGGKTYRAISQLAPFGKGNPMPVFLSREVEVVNCRQMGNNGKHLRLRLKHNGAIWDAVAFGQGDSLTDITDRMDIVFNFEQNEWMGDVSLRLRLVDMRPSTNR